MFSKLLKYDMKAIAKYWWIAAATSPIIAVFGGFCLNIAASRISSEFLEFVSGLGFIISIVGLIAFSVLNQVLILVRFYKNFFTDEGYLTFTLPVKRGQLLFSKLLSAVLFSVFTVIILAFDVTALIATYKPNVFFSFDWIKDFSRFVSGIYDAIGGYLFVYIAEALLAMLIMSVFGIISFYVCLTFAAWITKKHKILSAVGIYYLFTALIGFLSQFAAINGGIARAEDILIEKGQSVFLPAQTLIILGIIAFISLATAGLYLLEHYLLVNKLNLE